ncbi:Regulator of protease activity HflC, stomatin/prohibitin superfamily [Pseudobutyrivibrio sp. YE44]|uniref:SPFH domain-containing protein n=1 Tax=Pseudobutyrivibrio sp. YE44 TaxID=1520802 RepID=UPI00088263DB|nr:SPFH domain-containing protein [Pseudobutyrivibrio sp. YE44]SDB48520.1 Regulator of protease activity HflC, stomatin/prohibitin superfamily [Pseudobutyrivibrio sp. YE44]
MEFIIVLLVLLVVLIAFGIRIVPQGYVFVIEFLGKYHATWQAGFHVMIPFLQRVSKRVSLKEQVADFPPQDVITKDNVIMKIDTVVYFKVADPKLYAYGAERPILALENLTATTLRNLVGELELDQTLTSRDSINDRMRVILDEATDPWGIKVGRVELKNIIPPEEIQRSMEKQMKAERDRRETLLEAEGHKQASITRAEGDKQALVLKAEAERDAAIARATGQAESIRLVYEAEARGIEMLKEANMDERVLLIKKLEALEKMGDGRATKIVVPTDLASAAADLTFKTEMLGFGESTPIDKTAPKAAAPKKDDPCCSDADKGATTRHFVEDHVAFEGAN